MKIKTLLVLLLLGVFSASCGPWTSFVVNSEGDEGDANLSDGLCETINNECTLRAAIQQANNDGNGAFISFENVTTISPATALSALTGDGISIQGEGLVTLDGGQPAADCGGIPSGFPGLEIFESNGNTIDGLTVVNFGIGIEINGLNGDAQGNLIGGGPVAAVRNVIGGNCYGIYITGQGASGNSVAGNYIGTNADGTTANPNYVGIGLINGHNNLIGSTSASLSPTIDPIDQVAFWNLDEAIGNRADSVGSNTLVETSGTIASVPAIIDNGADFELADSEFFEVADNPDLSTGDIDFTLEGWVNLESDATVYQELVSKWNTGSVAEYALYYHKPTGRFIFEVYNSSGTVIGKVNNGAPVSTGTWYYIVAWHDSVNNLVGMSVNNGAAQTNATTGVPSNTAANFRMGADSNNETNFLDGVMDEWSFWKRLLTPQEMTNLYNDGNGPSGVAVNQEGNLISGNEGIGISLANADTNHIAGNLIGTTLDGLSPLGNGGSGIRIGGGSDNNTIGRDAGGLGSANVISANGEEGLTMYSSDNNIIAGNYIGANISGSAALGNGWYGIRLGAGSNGNVIGTNGDGISDELEGNLVSGNGVQINRSGIHIGGDDNVVAGNYIGTSFNGSAALGNSGAGVTVQASFITVGTNGDGVSDLLEANVISGNGESGVEVIVVSNNSIAGNFIGTDKTGASPLGNGGDGINIVGNSSLSLVGNYPQTGNVIAFNQGDGVELAGFGGVYPNIGILYNSIFSNGGLGINLHPDDQFDGITPNDVGDGDSGANDLLNFPVLDSALSINNTITISGEIVDGLANTNFVIQFFASPSCDSPSGHGEGKTFLGEFATQMTDGSGDVSFLANFAVSVPAGEFVTATASYLNVSSTSEFSACVEVLAGANAQLELEGTVQPPLVIVPLDNLNCRYYCTSQSEVADTLLMGIEYSPIGWDPKTLFFAFQGPTFGEICFAPPEAAGTELMSLTLNNDPITFDQLTPDVVDFLACPAFSTPTPTLDVDEGDNVTPVAPQCSDGIDNDGDGRIDLSDPQCRNASDNDEVNP